MTQENKPGLNGLKPETYHTLERCLGEDNGSFLAEALKASAKREPVFQHKFFGPLANEYLSAALRNASERDYSSVLEGDGNV